MSTFHDRDQSAAVASTSQFSPHGLVFPGAPPAISALEDVSFAFLQIRWRYEDGAIEAEDVSCAIEAGEFGTQY